MKNTIHVGCLAICTSLTLVARADDFGAVRDPYVGNWSGTLKTGAQEEKVHATVIETKTRYEVTFRAKPDPRAEAIVTCHGTVRQDQLILESVANDEVSTAEVEVKKDRVKGDPLLTRGSKWQGQPIKSELTGSFAGVKAGEYSLVKVPFQPSPTLGEKAPTGALILFDGTDLKEWAPKQVPADPIQWKLTESGALEVVSQRDGKKNKQDLATKKLFGDYRLRLEFKLADKPDATGQGRSNSGIIHLGVYETQILDSFGLYGRNNDCGGIYKTRDPDSNAGYPAGLWQTYDIEVKAPRFDATGNKTATARLTVRLNGVLVQDNVSVPNPTGGGKEAARGPIILQDHGNPVQYRNIWVHPLE